MAFDIEKALETHAWPFKEAKNILKNIEGKLPEKGYVLFETGYGPSGLPHIGTFGEVLRTIMVKNAFERISDIPTKLFCVSDDMDGMRKVPDIIPNRHEYEKYIGLPLTNIPDPFNTEQSYGHNMNARMQAFLNSFNFKYEFISATDCYKQGVFNEMLIKALEHYEDIMDIMLPTLGEERRRTYSPFLPICPETGHVLQVSIIEYDKKQHTITYCNELGNTITSEVTNGKCKLQWKPDFGMRWAAFDVDFEMYGKDHLVNGPIYTRICKVLQGKAPHQIYYELFLDEKGEKISKSKGNGLSIEDWLHYGTQDSLSYFMFLSPQKAKKLYFEIIPKCMDDYLNSVRSYHQEDFEKQLNNPVYHIHNGDVPRVDFSFSYNLLLNLVSACGTLDRSVITGYIKNCEAGIDIEHSPLVTLMVDKAINYYHDFIEPNKKFRVPTDLEKASLLKLVTELEKTVGIDVSAEELQSKVYAVGRESGMELRDWFGALYEVLLGSSQGPRFGSFIKLFGIERTIELINGKCQ